MSPRDHWKGSLELSLHGLVARRQGSQGIGQRPSLRAKAKQSISPRRESMDCFVASLLAMTANAVSRSRGTICPRVTGNLRDLFTKEGAGNAGCALHPR